MPDRAPENVQDFPRPPAIEPSDHRLRVMGPGGQIIADTTNGYRVLETHHPPTYYIPRSDVEMDRLSKIDKKTICEYKGQAKYFTIDGVGRVNEPHAWTYLNPRARFGVIKDYLSFYATDDLTCIVGDQVVRSQPGDFYGGWVTDHLTGKIKGASGTLHW
jgi:uncharacterized protein (DUF427 family)